MQEERLIYIASVLIGTPVVVISLASGNTIGPGETLAGLVALGGMVGLLRKSRLPKALARWRRPPKN